MAGLKGKQPELPQEITVYFNDETEVQVAVEWAEISKAKLNKIGVFELQATLRDYDLKTAVTIRVTNELGGEQNISRAKNGYEYPKAEASFTNRDATSDDRIEVIHDDVTSYEKTPHNRWTNWQRETRAKDWVSITFGDFEPEEYTVDQVEIHWFQDHGTSYPESFKIQYQLDDEWIDLENMQSNPKNPTLKTANYYTFDAVKTSAIRVNMVAQKGKGLAITELKMISKWPKAKTKPKVTKLELDGEDILADFKQKDGHFEYELAISDLSSIPEITATADDNTAIQIIPSVTAPSTAKVIARSDDGKQTEVYEIHFTLDKSNLEKGIEDANSQLANTEEGRHVGQFPKEAREALIKIVVQTKATLKRNSLTIQDLDEMGSRFLEAIKTYQASEIKDAEVEVDISALEELSKAAKEISNKDETYMEVSYEALQKALQNTESVLGAIETAEEVELEMVKLEKAIAELIEVEKALSANAIKVMLERYEARGELSNQKSVRALRTHLRAITGYEKQAASKKVIKYLKRFKLFLEHQEDKEFISEEASFALHAATNDLIKQWQSE